MSTKAILFQGGKFKAKNERFFLKDVIHEGTFFHSRTKEIIEFSAARVDNHHRNLNRYIAAGNTVPMRDGHTKSTLARIGKWPGPALREGKDLVVVAEMTNPDAAKLAKEGTMDGVSVVIEFDHTDTFGNHYDEVITAIDATDFPVVPGKPFVALSRDGEGKEIDTYVPKHLAGISPEGYESEDSMLKKLALALGLPEDATEEKVLAALKTREEDRVKALDTVKGFTGLSAVKPEELKAHGFELKDGKVVKLSTAPPADETPREKELRERLEKSERRENLSRVQGVKALIEGAAKDKIITPALIPAFTELASLEGDVAALCLSADGQDVQKKGINALARITEILKGLPRFDAAALQQLSAAELDEQKKIEKGAKTKASEVLARVTGTDGSDE